MSKLKNRILPKILVVGDFHAPIHEEALYRAFLGLGERAEKFGWHDYFKGYLFRPPQDIRDFFPWFYYRFENKFIAGPTIKKINQDLVRRVKEISPSLVFIYRGTHIFPETIKAIKGTGALVFGYNNDDPFSGKYPFYFWRHFLRSVPYYDQIFVYRKKNIEDYRLMGYQHISLLLAGYVKEKNYPIKNLPSREYVCDVIFAGHFEDDGRDEYLKTALNAGINLKLFGPEWHHSRYYDFFKSRLGEIYYLTGSDYNLALNSAKIALVFLSKLNNDTYTRRCFEITACGTFMLAPYTADLNQLFEEGKEAEYFRSKEEMLEKIKFYLKNEDKREKIARAGWRRLLKDRHEIKDRAKEIIETYNHHRERES